MMQSNALPKAGRMWRNTMKNAELIKALRQCRENGNCDTCEYNTGDSADCIDTMMAEAADELEAAEMRRWRT
jgi:hypothetical protein